ncbi:MAG: hypothetical protein JSU04_12185 [Bdellovibrionales bacterium]|nr:hypothetical protein [Bdellovibrionales bacterium]
MKKFVFALATVVTLAACSGNKTDVTAPGSQPPQSETPAPTPAPQKGIQTNPVDPGALTAVDALTVQGYKFVLVATKNNVDQVLVNEEANNLEFNVGDTVCRTKILSKEDPTYPGEELGVLQVVCDSHGVKLTSSASCSPRYPEVQSHFEVADGQDNYILDLVCRVKAP